MTNFLNIENTAAIMNNSFDRRAKRHGELVARAWVHQEGLFPPVEQPKFEWNPFSEFFEIV